jgi:hypothetical protein
VVEFVESIDGAKGDSGIEAGLSNVLEVRKDV